MSADKVGKYLEERNMADRITVQPETIDAVEHAVQQKGCSEAEIAKYDFRSIREDEAEIAADIEEICFPPNEACSREHMIERIKAASDLFLVAVEKETGKIVGFLNGIATNEMSFKDEFFTDATTHDPKGSNVMICGLDVLPEYRKQGLARELVYTYCRREEEKGRKRLVLTCHDNKVKMYKKFGFRDLGESDSEWGGVRWHEMDIFLNH